MVRLLNPPELHPPVGGGTETTGPEKRAPVGYGAYSHASIAKRGSFVAVAGQVPVNAKGKVVGIGDIEVQARQVLENIRTALKACGADVKDIVRTRTFVTDMRNSKLYAKVKEEFFDGKPPPGTLVEVNHLFLKEFLIEMEADAVLEE